MKNVSQTYLDIMQSSVIPKCEPTITLEYYDDNGQLQEVIWRDSDLIDINIKQGYDPLNRTLPYIEATWTEVYAGEINLYNEPTQYTGIKINGAVKIQFAQNTQYIRWPWARWESITWAEAEDMTWADLEGTQFREIIEYPTLYLIDRPQLQNDIITWQAVDLLSLMNTYQEVSYNLPGIGQQAYLYNVLANILLNERMGYADSPHILQAITKTANYMANLEYSLTLQEPIIIKSTTKDAWRNLAAACGRHYEFYEDIIRLRAARTATGLTPFTANVLKEYPTLTKNNDISAYKGKLHYLRTSIDRYTVAPETVNRMGLNLRYWFYRDYGVPSAGSADIEEMGIRLAPKYAVGLADNPDTASTYLVIEPLVEESEDIILRTRLMGEEFTEDNPLAVNRTRIERDRFLEVTNYFKSSLYTLDFEYFGNLAFECGDVVGVETNLRDNNQNVIKNAIIVEQEITYDGAITVKAVAHEVVTT